MPATITPFEPARAGTAPVTQAATAADQFANTGHQLLYVKNTDGSAHTVHIALGQTVDGITVGPRDVVVPAGAERWIGPFPPTQYNDGGNMVQLTYTSITGMNVGVMKMAVAALLSPA
jgi:hypothetical protein